MHLIVFYPHCLQRKWVKKLCNMRVIPASGLLCHRPIHFAFPISWYASMSFAVLSLIFYGRPMYRADHYILPCDFFLLFSSSSFFPRLISAAVDWMSTILPRMVWPQREFQMQVWNLLHAARWKCRTQKSRQKSPSVHHRITLSGYIFAIKAHIDNRKKTYWAAICPPHVPTIWWISAY